MADNMWFLSELRIAVSYFLINFRALAAERTSFVLQILGMMLNNTAFIIVWVLFAQSFGVINGWGAPEMIALQGYSALVFGLVFTLCGGISPFRTAVLTGAFDSVLLSPRALITRICTLSVRPSAVGDIIYGIICVGIYAYLIEDGFVALGILAVLTIPAFLIFASVLFATSCVSFFMSDSEELSRGLFELFFAPSMTPSSGMQGLTRILFIFVIPSITIAGLPIELVSHFSWFWFGVIWVLALLWPVLVYVLFLAGLRRYESGNMTGSRV